MSETPREFYLRAVVKEEELEIVMGLEFDPGTDDIVQLRGEMKRLAYKVAGELLIELGEHGHEGETDALLSLTISAAMGKAWPGRRYFLEVQHDDPNEGWVQVITPAGWPPQRSL